MDVVRDALMRELEARLLELRRHEERKVGFPGWSTPFPAVLLPFFSHELNNYGDPLIDPVFPWHCKDVEREVVAWLARLFCASAQGAWGYVTSGSSEAILHGLWVGRSLHPDARIYCSEAAHPCVMKNAHLLDREVFRVATDARGEMDYAALGEHLASSRPACAIVVATIGTTLTEAVDDVREIRRVLQRAGVDRHYVHADGALSAIPLAASTRVRPAFGLHEDGVDSLSVSGHKFLGAPFPCGVLLTRAVHRGRSGPSQLPSYTGSAEPTIASSRNGHAALVLWHRLRTLGLDGLRRLAEQTQRTAAYAVRRLLGIGWRAWRFHAHACTVVLESPPRAVLQRWPMPSVDGWSHLVCTPAVSRERIDRFVAALSAETSAPLPARLPPKHAPAHDVACSLRALALIAAEGSRDGPAERGGYEGMACDLARGGGGAVDGGRSSSPRAAATSECGSE